MRVLLGYDPERTVASEEHRNAAVDFFVRCGLDMTDDAVDQLVDAFLPALRIMCERGYDPDGATWRESGWRGTLTDIRKKFTRLWFRGWRRGRYDPDSAIDLINFCGFYYRLHNEGKPWGEWGEPEQKGV